MAAKSVEILLRVLGASDAKSAFDDVAGGASTMGDTVKKAGDDSGKGLDAAAAKAESLRDKLESVRAAGVGMSAAGAGALILGNHLSDAFLEADRLNGRLESILAGKGLSAASADVKKLGNEIAGLTGGDDDAISAAIAGAVASGRIQSLKEYGIVIDANGQSAIAAAGKISGQAKAQETLNQVLKAGAGAVSTLTANMDPATASLGQFNVRWGNLEEGIGQGAARAKAAILGGLLSPVMSLLEQSPGLQTFAGGFIEIGGAALSGVGGLVTFGSQALILVNQFGILRAAKLGNAEADTAAAIAAGVDTAAIELEGDAAVVAAGKLGILSRAKALAGGVGSLTGGAALGVGAAALAVTAYGVSKTAEGMDAVGKESDEDLAKNHGLYGQIWAYGGSGIGELLDRAKGDVGRGDAAESQSAALFAKMRAGAPSTPGLSPMLRAVAPVLTTPGVLPKLEAPRGVGNISNADAMKSRDLGAEMIRALMQGGQIGGGLSTSGPGDSMPSAGGGRNTTIPLRLRNGGTKQNANGSYTIKVIADDIQIPYQGLGSLRGRL